MAQFCNDGRLGIGDLADVDTSPIVPLGTVIRFYDTVTGQEGEAQYIQAAAATTTVGMPVVLNNTAKAVKASSTTHAGSGMGLGFIMAASLAANEYGWAQIQGKAKVKAGTVAAAAKMFLTTTAGTVDDAQINGAQVLGAVYETADGTPAAGFAYANIERPFVQGQVV